MKKNCYHRKDGRWEYSKQENGLLYYTIANTYRELLEKIKSIKPKQIKQVKRIKTKILTFLQYFKFYIDNYVRTKKLKQESLRSWERTADNYIAKYFPRMPLDKLTTEDIQKFINSIDKERTREIIFQQVVKVLQKAYVTGKIKKDITLGLEKPERQNIKDVPPLNIEEQQALIQKVKNTNLYAFVMFSIIIGSRREETMRFNYDTDVNENKQIIYIKGTKTKQARKAPRQVKVTKAFIQFLKDYLPKGKFDFNICYPTKKIGEIFKELNIKSCLHGLRHTCATNLYFLGAKDKYRQLQLGHASIVTTNDIYTNIKENIPKTKLLEIYGDLYPKFDETFDETFDTN